MRTWGAVAVSRLCGEEGGEKAAEDGVEGDVVQCQRRGTTDRGGRKIRS